MSSHSFLTHFSTSQITPKSTLEHVYTVVVMLTGHALYAYIFGLMATMVSNMDYAGAR